MHLRLLTNRVQAAAFILGGALFIATVGSCAAKTSGGGGSDSSSHWLQPCEEDAECETGLSCLCGVCTRACDSNENCADLRADAVCTSGGAKCDAPADNVCTLHNADATPSASETVTVTDSEMSTNDSEATEPAGTEQTPANSTEPLASATETSLPDETDVDTLDTDTSSAETADSDISSGDISSSDETDSDVSDDDTSTSETVEPDGPCVESYAADSLPAEFEGTSHEPGAVLCVAECQYVFQSSVPGYDFGAWLLNEGGVCPRWTQAQCDEVVATLEALPAPCSRQADCEAWGGQTAATACEVAFVGPQVNISRLNSVEDLEAARELYAAAVTGGCGYGIDFDVPPVSPVCIDGQCSRKLAPGCLADDCPGQDVSALGECASVVGYFFDGSRCQAVSCSCSGSDCEQMFADRASCEAAQPLECVTSSLFCAPQPLDYGDCEAALGIGWNGAACVTVSGCSAPEGALFDSVEACDAIYSRCVPPSEQDITSCSNENDCIVVPYQHCCGSSKRAIHSAYLPLYEATPEWQVFDQPECADICRDDSAVTEAFCDFNVGSNPELGTCTLVFPE